MEQVELEALARQLACPSGEPGKALATKMNGMNALITARSIDTLKPDNGESILEIGFGNGELSKQIITSVGQQGKFTGIERSAILAQEASAHFAREGMANVTVHAADYSEITLENGSIDGVLAVNVLYFIQDTGSFFRRIHTWLKPGGRFVIGVRSLETLEKMPFIQYGFILRPLDEVVAAMKNAGFSRVDSTYYDEGTTQFDDMELSIDALIIKGMKE